MRSGIEGVAFDLDGTLYPNYRLHVRLVPFLLKEWRLTSAFGKARNIIRKKQETLSHSGGPVGGFYENQAAITAEILGAQPAVIQEKINRLIYRGWEPLFKSIKLFKEAAETLAALKEAGYKLGLLSDFPPEIKLENLKISGIWDAVLCSECCGALKPHLLSFKELAAAMILPPEKILYVGNSHTYDVAGANLAGMKTALIKSRFIPGSKKKPKADFIFSNYRQLYDFMLK
ncbi:MAG: HAD family hydrolase [Treponema sp.]|nr:HAD family hydrolase [Treponema sp.]